MILFFHVAEEQRRDDMVAALEDMGLDLSLPCPPSHVPLPSTKRFTAHSESMPIL